MKKSNKLKWKKKNFLLLLFCIFYLTVLYNSFGFIFAISFSEFSIKYYKNVCNNSILPSAYNSLYIIIINTSSINYGYNKTFYLSFFAYS